MSADNQPPGFIPEARRFQQGATTYPPGSYAPQRRRRRGSGCLVSLLVIVLLLAGGWFVFGRPYVHNLAQTQINQELSSMVDQIPPTAALLQAGMVLPVHEDTVNNLIVLESAPSDVVQHLTVHFTPSGMLVDFQLYGLDCVLTGTPAASGGKLVMTNVSVTGVIQLIMSADEVTVTINTYLAKALDKIQHPVSNVQLKQQEVDLTLG